MTDPMALPPGKRCEDCQHYLSNCSWFGLDGGESSCLWAPSRFLPMADEVRREEERRAELHARAMCHLIVKEG